MKRLDCWVNRFRQSIDSQIATSEVSNGHQALLPVEHLLHACCFVLNDVKWRDMPLSKDAINKPLLLRSRPDFAALEVWLKIQSSSVDS